MSGERKCGSIAAPAAAAAVTANSTNASRSAGVMFSSWPFDDRDAGELLLRLEQRRHELLAEAERIRDDEALVHGLADDRGQHQRLGEVRVVAQVLRGV